MARTRITFRTPAPRSISATDPRYEKSILSFDIAYMHPEKGELVIEERMVFADTDCPAKYLARLGVSIEDAVVTPRSK